MSSMIALSLAACSGSDEAGADGGEKVTLDFWAFGATNYEELLKEYEEQNPNVEAGLPTDPEEAGVKLKEATGKPFVVSMEMACRAYLDDYPDAVAASALAKKMNAEILLVHPTRDMEQ
ncbi:hypothetical protein FZC80_16350 [Rossellomorea aquimaris]|uniref:Uncharacterized protein n=2 Tax=Bacillaceae TaxID=186817 RepID=A0A5D4TMS5_9BACI|nr:cell wall-binding repeat-containing protein [Rossellomorea aquimaris]TYS75772.1 hypothetical protein FZC80_16350 [Rossellomorea aquimaris]